MWVGGGHEGYVWRLVGVRGGVQMADRVAGIVSSWESLELKRWADGVGWRVGGCMSSGCADG